MLNNLSKKPTYEETLAKKKDKNDKVEKEMNEKDKESELYKMYERQIKARKGWDYEEINKYERLYDTELVAWSRDKGMKMELPTVMNTEKKKDEEKKEEKDKS